MVGATKSLTPVPSIHLLVCICRSCAAPLATAVVIFCFASLEAFQAGSEFGHSHGLSLLALARISRAISEVHAEAADAFEAFRDRLHPTCRELIRLAFNAKSCLLASAIAVLASVAECRRSTGLGGHYGLVIFALADVVHRLHAVPDWNSPVLVLGPVLSLSLAAAAVCCAAVELVGDLRPGAHHGVAILALAYMAENIRRLKNDRMAVSKMH